MIVDAGKNGQDVVVRGQEVASKKVVSQKVNGWMTMPPDHWQVVKEKLNGVAKYEAEHGINIPALAEVVPLK